MRRDGDAQRQEMEGGSDLVNDESLKTLREYINVVEDKETKLAEIRDMLRTIGVATNIQMVGDDGEILATAWVFVALNILIAVYLAQGLLIDPILKTL